MQDALGEWWRTGFGPGYLALYDGFLGERTPIEIDQLEVLLDLKAPLRILDLPCGQGRHAIELARRGYDVTGVDLSAYLLGVAKKRATAAGVRVRWLVGDMRQTIAGDTFDMVLNLFTSFGYFADEEDDRRVLSAARAMLRRGGRVVVEVINGDRLMAHFQEREWFAVGTSAVIEQRRLDRTSRRMVVERTVATPTESEVALHAIRLYTGHDLEAMLRVAGFGRVDLYGDWDGAALSPESLRVLAVGTTAD